MEKLIELLNEYEKHISLGGLADWREFDGNLHYYSNYKDEYIFDNVYYRIISKNYGFIKWLVENDKIKLDNEELVSLMSELGERRNPVKCLLMLLSIQDEPIRFLCEIIK